jgi:hypothetical protein
MRAEFKEVLEGSMAAVGLTVKGVNAGAMTMMMQNIDWLLRLASMKLKRTGSDGNEQLEALVAMMTTILPRRSS